VNERLFSPLLSATDTGATVAYLFHEGMVGCPAVCAAEQREEHRDLFSKYRDIAVDDRPDFLRVHAKICVNQNIPKTDHLFPGNAGRSASKVRGEAGGCFPDDPEMVDHPDLHQFVLQESISAPDGIPLNLLDRFLDVEEPVDPIPHIGTASFKIRFLYRSLSAASVTTSTRHPRASSRSWMSAM